MSILSILSKFSLSCGLSPFLRPIPPSPSDPFLSVRSAPSVYASSPVQNAKKSNHHDKPRHFTTSMLVGTTLSPRRSALPNAHLHHRFRPASAPLKKSKIKSPRPFIPAGVPDLTKIRKPGQIGTSAVSRRDSTQSGPGLETSPPGVLYSGSYLRGCPPP